MIMELFIGVVEKQPNNKGQNLCIFLHNIKKRDQEDGEDYKSKGEKEISQTA